MYINKIEIENVGPISNFSLQAELTENNNPKPIIAVGKNGSGKSILIAHIVNALLAIKQTRYSNLEIEDGRAYKFRTPRYVRAGKEYSYSLVEIDNKIKVEEWQLTRSKNSIHANFKSTEKDTSWEKIPEKENSQITNTAHLYEEETLELLNMQSLLYFPANRYEEPAWLNYDNLTNKVEHTDLKNIGGRSDRPLIALNPMKINNSWILDIVYQAYVKEIIPLKDDGQHKVYIRNHDGECNKMFNAVMTIFSEVIRVDERVTIDIGTRKSRIINLSIDGKLIIPNIFQLSTGELQLINMFVSILRDYDHSHAKFTEIDDVKGIVIIDEIDTHLHVTHQIEVLPKLIKMFPKVQFLITTHSPLFLLGLSNQLGEENIDIIEMPTGIKIKASQFTEFIDAYEVFCKTEKYKEDMRERILQSMVPIVLVEGAIDIKYIKHVATVFGKTSLIEKIHLEDGDGHGNLSNLWKGVFAKNNKFCQHLPHKVLLLYDGDQRVKKANCGKAQKISMPFLEQNPIKKGIENLFSEKTIRKIEKELPQSIDKIPAYVKTERGKNVAVEEKIDINTNEKSTVLKWICENGTREDFENFIGILDIIESFVSESD